MKQAAARPITTGCDQGKSCPPRLRAPRSDTMVMARMTAPTKSMRRSFEGSPLIMAREVEAGSFRATRKMAIRIVGPCPTNDHLQPTVSARRPPSEPPILRPRVATTFT